MQPFMQEFVMTIIASLIAAAATITIVDSGTDLIHRQIAPAVWTNPSEISNNSIDDDGNGFVDDLHGWNFAERNNQVIDYEHLNTFPEDCFRFFEVQGKVLLGTATEEEKSWLSAARADTELMKHLRRFANFAHGTHVAGIALGHHGKFPPVARLAAVKLIPTGRAPRDPEKSPELIPEGQPDYQIETVLAMIARANADLIVAGLSYGINQGARVINGSFGVTEAPLRPVMENLLQQLLGRPATAEEISHYTRLLIELMNNICTETVAGADGTLFVFAAGNDGSDNDTMPVAPGSVGTGNSLSVAATAGRSVLAGFSNYGMSVDVAAPGVAIRSSVPGDRYLTMSGTSMAAPYVARTAMDMLKVAPGLTAEQLKQLIMATVDRKKALAGRVKARGVVNPPRAVAAAAATTFAGTGNIAGAAGIARLLVPDLPDDPQMTGEKTPPDLTSNELARPFPLPFPFTTSLLVKQSPPDL